MNYNDVTILILIDGFLQCEVVINNSYQSSRHNPYFNRWFSAMGTMVILSLTG